MLLLLLLLTAACCTATGSALAMDRLLTRLLRWLLMLLLSTCRVRFALLAQSGGSALLGALQNGHGLAFAHAQNTRLACSKWNDALPA